MHTACLWPHAHTVRTHAHVYPRTHTHSTEYRHHIAGGGEPMAVLSYFSTQLISILFPHFSIVISSIIRIWPLPEFCLFQLIFPLLLKRNTCTCTSCTCKLTCTVQLYTVHCACVYMYYCILLASYMYQLSSSFFHYSFFLPLLHFKFSIQSMNTFSIQHSAFRMTCDMWHHKS